MTGTILIMMDEQIEKLIMDGLEVMWLLVEK